MRREETVQTPHWTYTTAAQQADGVAGAYRIEVAQISARVGPGFRAALTVTT